MLSYHLYYTIFVFKQYRDLVKVHGVFPSSHNVSASARTIQFHRKYEGDSGEVVTPFMHVGTYPTRNFATLGPSELQPPFTGVSGLRVNVYPSPSSTGQVSVPLHPLSSLQRPVFLVNSRPSLFSDTSKKVKITFYGYSLSRSYRVNLPSSFFIFLSRALVYSTYPPVSV